MLKLQQALDDRGQAASQFARGGLAQVFDLLGDFSRSMGRLECVPAAALIRPACSSVQATKSRS
jgi:hypothetical protein